MGRLQKTTVWALSFLQVASQFVPPPTELIQAFGHLNISVRYKEVPGSICETTPGVKTYTGYVDVAENQHMFFWFFEARHQDPTQTPLTIWVDGGPGTPSTLGAFDESGPCFIDPAGNLVYNIYSWTNVTNMLYIDQPISTGFSYSEAVPGYSSFGELVQLPSNDCPSWVADPHTCGTYSKNNDTTTANSTMVAAQTYWRFMQGFTGAFPQWTGNGIHFYSISYGGHYAPVFNAYTLRQNAQIANGSLPGASHIDIRSVVIGNGWYDPPVHFAAYYNFTVNPGNPYGVRPYTKDVEQRLYNNLWGPGNCLDQVIQCQDLRWPDVCADADNFCAKLVEYMLDRAGRDEYDIREVSDDFPYDQPIPGYLNQPHILEAIGAAIKFTTGSNIISRTFTSTGDDSLIDGTINDVRYLVANGVYVVEYAGDADYNCNYLGGEVVAEKTGPSGYVNAGYSNISTPDGIVHGVVKQSNYFAFARIYNSGHEVPFFQPLTGLTIVARTAVGKDIATGLIDIKRGGNYSTTGPAKSTYKEGPSFVVNHPLPLNATYNITTNRPNPPASKPSPRRSARRSARQLSKRGFVDPITEWNFRGLQ